MTERHTSGTNLGISPEEFEQYQRQFIEERSEKYALLEKVRRLEQDVVKLSSEKNAERDFDKLIKDKFQKPFQTLLSRTKRESESSELIIQQENDALQKRLHSQEDDFQRQNVLLMQELQHLTIRNEELERKMNSPSLQNSDEISKREEFQAKIRSLETELAAFRNLTSSEAEPRPISDDDRSTIDLDAATEEIRTLKALLESNKKSYEMTIFDQEKTVANLIRDLEGKQTSVQLLLSERDQLQRVNRDLIAASAADREKLLSSLKSEKARFMEENHELRQAVEEERVVSRTRAEDVERQMKDLLEQMDVTGQQTKRDSDELLQEHKRQIASLLHQVEDLTAKFAPLEQSESELRQMVATLQQERSRFVAEENEMTRLVEKRKATIDDLTAHLTNMKQQYEEEKEKCLIETAQVLQDLNRKLERADAEALKVAPLEAELRLINIQLQNSLIEQETLSKDLFEKRSHLERLESVQAEETSDLKRQLEETLADSTRKQAELCDQLQRTSSERDEAVERLTRKIADLEQRLQDRTEEVKIIERKNTGVSRDLQKQLQVEKKHVEKLQNKLNELLRDGFSASRAPDDAADFTERDETGSVSSWSFVSSKGVAKKSLQLDGTSTHSNTDTEIATTTGMTEQEVRDLVTRITRLQQEKAGLLERVSMLETGNAAMAQDLINKSAVIDRYLQATPVLGHHGHHGHLSSKEADAAFSLRSLIDRLGRDKTMDVETQKNLRHLLEETLTKNVHLQKNMELLTEELDRLRGSTPPRL